ncbi:hypothetical protein CMI37_11460 [Candidatus Pacearchaeota archaeon]|nr:hypothetical protein [Candidatus Pacearchaeota archaeon]|tara:strand:+ start:8165 stop:8401 length:237 start_codon:yes stop_codon:yes gene_type:complete
MAGKKTRDGIKLSKVVKLAQGLGATVRGATKHPFVLNYDGMRPCPVATSTDAKRMVAPWIAEITGCTNQEAYQSMRNA